MIIRFHTSEWAITFFVVLIAFLSFVSCKTESKSLPIEKVKAQTITINSDHYELVKPLEKVSAVLVLFGGYPESAGDIKREFAILDMAAKNDIAILFMNFNGKLWLEEVEKTQLATLLQNALTANELPTNNIYIGGFSSGGNISLLITDFIIGKTQYDFDPKGVFVIDSPIDLLAMYESSKRIMERSTEGGLLQESTWLLKTLENQFGHPTDSMATYERYAVFTSKTGSFNNIKHLKNTKIRLYTEPDSLWWKKFNANYEDMNASKIERLYKVLEREFEESNVEYITTNNKGFRSDGERNPHSWSIVDKNDLVRWILD